MLDDFDRLLDESLKSYLAGPQRTGLEERILLRARRTRRQKLRWYFPAFALAALMVALTVALWPIAQPRQVQTRQVQRRQLENVDKPKLHPVMPATARVRVTQPRIHPVTQRTLLLRAGEPLTAQERALQQIALTQPEQLAQLNKPTERITVPVIEIKPLSEGEN
jgi:hypothetical protein